MSKAQLWASQSVKVVPGFRIPKLLHLSQLFPHNLLWERRDLWKNPRTLGGKKKKKTVYVPFQSLIPYCILVLFSLFFQNIESFLKYCSVPFFFTQYHEHLFTLINFYKFVRMALVQFTQTTAHSWILNVFLFIFSFLFFFMWKITIWWIPVHWIPLLFVIFQDKINKTKLLYNFKVYNSEAFSIVTRLYKYLILSISITPKRNPILLAITPNCHPKPHDNYQSIFCLYVFSYPCTSYINGITLYVTFSVWLLSLSKTFSRFIHVIAGINISFFLMTE